MTSSIKASRSASGMPQELDVALGRLERAVAHVLHQLTEGVAGGHQEARVGCIAGTEGQLWRPCRSALLLAFRMTSLAGSGYQRRDCRN